MRAKSLFPVLLAFMVAVGAGCGKKRAPNELPPEWYVSSPSDVQDVDDPADDFDENPEGLDKSVDDLYSATGEAMDEVGTDESLFASSPVAPLLKPHPKGWVPWHLAAMVAEFSVSVKGLIGALVMKGTPSVVCIWRKQYPKAVAPPLDATLLVLPDTKPADLAFQLEPAIQAVLSSGEVKDEKALRKNLLTSAHDFLFLARVLEAAPQSKWWVSRFRLDLTVDVSGTVTPIVGAGVESRFRFEWHRMKRKLAKVAKPPVLTEKEAKIHAFVLGVGSALESVAEDAESVRKLGFVAQSFRTGVGFSIEGKFGVIKSSAALLGHVYFSTDVEKPVVNPKPLLVASFKDLSKAAGLDAKALEAEAKKFKKGLKKALKIGKFFAARAAKSAGERPGKWRIHELKTGFDISLSGKVGLATVGGLGSTEISFYNQRF